jgi:hypothetical protein
MKRGYLEMQAVGVPDVVIDGVVEEADPPRKLVHTYRLLFSEAMKAEGFTRVTWEIEKATAGFAITFCACRGR